MQFKRKRYARRDIETVERLPITALLCGVEDKKNVGSIFRLAEGFLIDRLFMTGKVPKPDKNISIGSQQWQPYEYVQNVKEHILCLKSQGVKVVGVEIVPGSISLFDYVFDFPVCLILGNEAGGIPEEVLALCDVTVEIPMYGLTASFNVATAFGMACYEAVKQLSKR